MYIKALPGEKNESLMSRMRGLTQCFFSSYQVLHKAAAKKENLSCCCSRTDAVNAVAKLY